MIDVALIFIGIIVLFTIFLFVRKVCALCAAVSITWIALLAAHYMEWSIDPVLIGLLMGGSVVGLMYFLEEKLSEEYALFKLPFFLTLVLIAYIALVTRLEYQAIIVVLVVWTITFVVYIQQDVKGFKKMAQKIIACCKNW